MTGDNRPYKIRIGPETCFRVILLLGLYYYSYRYIFRWANDITSETYAATPWLVMTAKYVICAVFLLFALAKGIGGSMKCGCGTLETAGLIFLFLQSSYAFMWLKDSGTLVLMTGTAAAAGMCMLGVRMDFQFLDRIFGVYIGFNIVYELIQIGLYLWGGRLPAIAWSGGGLMKVRFGGAIDDPLAFSLFCAFLIPYAADRLNGWKRTAVVLALLVFLGLTWTMTSIVALAGIWCLKNIWTVLKRHTIRKGQFLLLLLAVIVSAAILLYGRGFLAELYEVKKGSISGHVRGLQVGEIPLMALLGLVPETRRTESGILKMLFNCGMTYTVVFYLLGICSVLRLYEYQKRIPEDMAKYRPVIRGMLYYQTAFMIGSLNLPYPYIFFNMLLFAMFMGMSLELRGERKR